MAILLQGSHLRLSGAMIGWELAFVEQCEAVMLVAQLRTTISFAVWSYATLAAALGVWDASDGLFVPEVGPPPFRGDYWSASCRCGAVETSGVLCHLLCSIN
jgi:hypothetical protein